jgi:hypothetical protein
VPPRSWPVGGETLSKNKAAGWPKSKPVHSPENRTGQAWRAGSVQVLVENYEGAKLIILPAGHFQCRYCLNIIRIDTRGYAACVNCGTIHNDGGLEKSKISNREKKRLLERLKYDCKHNTG